MAKRFVSIGECMIEMSAGEGGLYRLGFAGDTLNTAWYARAALPDSWQVDYVTALGDDTYSGQIRAFLDAHEIGTSQIATIPNKRPGLYLIHQQDGDRHFTYWRETSAAKQLADDPARLDQNISGAELIYFSGITMAILSPDARQNLLAVLNKAKSAGAKIAYDPNIRPALWADRDAIAKGIEQAASVADFALPTYDDDVAIFEDASPEAMAARYRGYGVGEVVVKDGAKEALIVGPKHELRVAAKTVETVVDPTGAGDSFAGTYIAARLSGLDPHGAAERAHAIAAVVITHPGALVPMDSIAVL